MAKDAPDAPVPSEPSRIENLRAVLKKIGPSVKIERRPADAASESHACVVASWGRSRVSDVVVDGVRSLDDAECRVLESVIAHLSVA